MAGAAMAVKAERGMGDQLLLLPLTERSVHLCVDMQRIFSTQVLADAMDGQGLAGRGGAREPPPQTNRPNPSSAELPRQREADALIVSGSETDVCVLATVLDAVDIDLRVIVRARRGMQLV
jgi:hypothetical protein